MANCYLLSDGQSGKALVVDPGDEADKILAHLKQKNLEAELLVATHGHIDHVGAARAIQKATGAPMRLHRDEEIMLEHLKEQAAWVGMQRVERPEPSDPIRHDEKIDVAGLQVHVLHTPGHTPGGVCYHLPQHGIVLTGDTLFSGTIGRSDLPGGNAPQLIRSIRERLLSLPASTRVLPGHGPATTIQAEKTGNPFL